jgi:hypothetical protein
MDVRSSMPNLRERLSGDLNCIYMKDNGYLSNFGLDMTGQANSGLGQRHQNGASSEVLSRHRDLTIH